MMKKLTTFLICMSMLCSNMSIAVHGAGPKVNQINAQIAALPETMIGAQDVEATYKQARAIQDTYNAFNKIQQANVVDYDKVETLLDGKSATLSLDNVDYVAGSALEGKTIGYLGSSITYGFATGGVAFADYIQKITGSTSVKQAISGGPLAKVEGVRDEVSYITQLTTGAITPDTDLDLLVVQVSTNDAALGIDMGELSDSYNLEDLDYSTIIGAMEYIAAYAKETWGCPVAFYTNPYLSDEAITAYCQANNIEDESVLKDPYQTVYADMIQNVYKVMEKWDGYVIDMWNNAEFQNTDVIMRDYYMNDPIHPTNAGYLFFYTPYIQSQLEEIISSQTYTLTESDYGYTYQSANTIDYSSVYSPVFEIYAGDLSLNQAEALLDKLDMIDTVNKWAGTINIITPANGESYTEEDAANFLSIIGAATSNIKVIGIDEGATFVNNYISQEAYAVAGIMTYGGEMEDGLELGAYVPAYISNACDNAVAYFISVNDETVDPLQKTVVANDATLAEAFDNAWEEIFSKNYRQMNEYTEFYMADPWTYTEPYLLIKLENYAEEGIQYNPVYNEPVNGEGEYTWFEYVPESVLDAEDGTVPLVITLHGNGNDPRLMGDTTGWPALAAQEGFIVIAPEWQDVVYDSSTHEPGPNYFGCDGLEGDKLIEWLEDVIEVKYPQIDTSRIYVSGLSAGGSASVLYAAKYSDVFAGAGAQSAPGIDKVELASIAEDYDAGEVALYYVAGDHDFFGMIPVDGSSTNSFQVGENLYLQSVDENCSIWSFIQSYYKINGLEVPETWNMEANPYYGIELEDQQWTTIGVKDALVGTVSNDNGTIMKFAAIKNQAHWTYKPEAAEIWDFLKDYSRDTETGELVRASDIIVSEVANDSTTVYKYDASAKTSIYLENQVNKVQYMIYPDHQVDAMEASDLLRELGIVEHLDANAAVAYIINPVGENYTEDDAAFIPDELDAYGSMLNTKVIGIGNGATFVNQYVSQYDWGIAGIMSVGGEAGVTPKYSVPAYVSGEGVAEAYITANNAEMVSEENGLTTYVNPDNSYEIVVANSNEETLAEAFDNAWSTVLSKNIRIGNIGGTFYSMKNSAEREWEYASYVIADELGIETTVVTDQDLDEDGMNNLWYEYVPESVKDADEGTVPVVMLVHGNGNDARTQFETSGWAQVAAENGIILIAPEWQGTTEWDAMTSDDSTTAANDIIKMLEIIEEKYPQIDTSRIYAEGLSRGGLNSIDLGITQTKTFAAVGSHSCGTMDSFFEGLTEVAEENAEALDMPFYFVAGTKDHFLPLTDMGETGGVFEAVQLYEKLNDMNVTEFATLSAQTNEWFGMELENYGEIENPGSLTMMGGTLTNSKGVQISLNAVEGWGHWNYEPTAQLMWNFFSQYSRDTETGEIITAMNGMDKIQARSEVSWTGNVGYGYGTYPERALTTVTIEYLADVDASNLTVNSFSVQDTLYAGQGVSASGVDYNNGYLTIDNVTVDGNKVILTVSTSSGSGILVSSDGNFIRKVCEFTVTQNVDVKDTDGKIISTKGASSSFDQDAIYNYGADEFEDLILTSETAGNNIYVKYYLPENYDATKEYPMVIHITGGGQQFTEATPDAAMYGENNYGVELNIDLTPSTFSVDAPEDTIMVTMQCLKSNQPEGYDGAKDVCQVIEYFLDHYAVDADRVYAVGNSQGGVYMSKAVYYRPDLFTAYLPCNTSIYMGAKKIDAENPDTTSEVYQGTYAYCKAITDEEVKVYFNVGRNDFTGAYLDDAYPYQLMQEMYAAKGYSEEQIKALVNMWTYENSDFEAVGSAYYHGATGLMCLNTEMVNWLYAQTKNHTLPYNDVAGDKWYSPYVEEAYKLGIMTGKSETTFDPYANMTRGQVVTVLYRLSGESGYTYNGTFKDVEDGKYYSEAVEWAVENKIITGYASDNTFRPGNAVTRQELALMLYRYARYMGADVSARADLKNFPDASNVSKYAQEAMEWAVAEGLISGDQGRLNPKNTANRAQACKMIVETYRAIK